MTNNKRQTAVEWYLVKRDVLEIEVRLGKLSANEYEQELIKAEQQAKAIHREEIKSTFYEGAFRESCESGQRYKYVGEEDAEKFYNETYGGK